MMNRILSLDNIEKSFLILSIVTPFYFLSALWAHFVLYFDPMPGKMDLEQMTLIARDFWSMCALSVFLFLVGIVVKKRFIRSDIVYMHMTITLTVLTLCYCGYLIGLLSIVSGLVMMSFGIIGLVLFSVKLVSVYWFSSYVIIFGGAFLSSLGYIDYSPLFIGAPTGEKYPEPFWVFSIFLYSLPFSFMFMVVGNSLIDKWKAYDAEILRLASIDPLTQVKNRRSLMETLNAELSNQERVQLEKYQLQDVNTSCIIMDLDHFKRINQRYGQKMGDDILVRVSKTIKQCLRECDIVGRYGGEEFLIILPQTSLGRAAVVAERCREALAEMEWPTYNGQKLEVTASFGVASVENNLSSSTSQIIQSADEALYEAKERGRNCVVTSGEAKPAIND